MNLFFDEIGKSFGFSIKEWRKPNTGKIAQNYAVTSDNDEKFLIRLYPGTYCRRQLNFEIESLLYFSTKLLPVPKLYHNVLNGDSSDFYKNLTDQHGHVWFCCCYSYLEGQCANQEHLCKALSEDAATLLLRMLTVSVDYEPDGLEPKGDLSFIRNIFRQATDKHLPSLSRVTVRMFEVLRDPVFEKDLSTTPKGIVHADYFYENIILDNFNKIKGVIDFGDAYHGYVVMDIAIAAMEFSIEQNEEFNFDYFCAFIVVFKPWLKDFGIEPKFLYKLILVNCVRFTAHLSNLGCELNPYVERFIVFDKEEFKTKFIKTIENI